jgi:hypothetical protein
LKIRGFGLQILRTKLHLLNLQSEILLPPARFPFRELEFMRFHIHPFPSKVDSLSFQPETLFHRVVAA